jgi:putative transposase
MRLNLSSFRRASIEKRSSLRRPTISLFEQRTALRAIRSEGQRTASEAQIFRRVEEQRRVIVKAKRTTVRARRRSRSRNLPSVEVLDQMAGLKQGDPDHEAEKVDYDIPVEAYDVGQ